MANDIDMWKDIRELDEEGLIIQAQDLFDCFHLRYTEGQEEDSDRLKEHFIKKYGYWGNWY